MADGFKTENLRIILDTPLGPDKFFVRDFSAEERLSGLFRIDLDLLSADKKFNMDSLLGKSVTLKVMLASGERCFMNGVVSRMRQIGSTVTLANYQAEIVPALWLLSLNVNSRIFQGMTVPDIIHKVLKDSGVDIAVEDKLEGTYAEWEYCVQYQESDFAYINRLMEQEGIFYYFKHADGSHTLVLGDKPGHHEDCPVETDFELLLDESGRSEKDYVTRFNVERSIRAGIYCCTDYNFKAPTEPLLVKQSGKDQPEIFEYPGEYETRNDGDLQARIRLEELEWQRHTIAGAAECRAFRSGHKFNLTIPGGGPNEGSYLLLNVNHHASQAGEIGSESGDGQNALTYTVGFGAIPAGVPYRPPRLTPRPGIFGTQTAVVVGKAGEEIWTDKYGRVKVQFFWDRKGKNDENSSCWIRCAHNVAGKTWGQIFIPRIGQEVLVSFIDGDPDRPIIIGSVYNDEQMPPYDLPSDQTKSTIKSRSSKGGGPPNFNEFRFEDKKGGEEIYLHAEKDYNQITENDRTEDVGHDRSLHVAHDKHEKVDNHKNITIGANHGETVRGNMKLNVGGNRTQKVTGNQSNTIDGNRSVTVGGNQTATIGGNKADTVSQASAETVALAKALTIGAGYQVSVGGAMNETVAGFKSEEVGAYRLEAVAAYKKTTVGKKFSVTVDQKYELEGKEEVAIKSGAGTVTMKKDGKIEISGTDVTLSTSAGKVHIDAGGIITIKGTMVKINT
jgi:type VI secretion system secreted protein VgrG